MVKAARVGWGVGGASGRLSLSSALDRGARALLRRALIRVDGGRYFRPE